jgi:imidazolonepropionase-like amidohydrolase
VAAGVAGLAHTPTSILTDETVEAWSGGAVITTLQAFGGGSSTLDNLGRLQQAGSTVLYGTDMGNVRTPGIVGSELELMLQAGMSPLQIVAAGTWVPAAWWGLSELGSLEAGKQASVVIVETNPLDDVSVLASPSQVWIDGIRRD